MNYLTDTSVVSPIMNDDPLVLERIQRLRPTDLLFTSVVTEAEIEYGLLKLGPERFTARRQALNEAFSWFVDVLPVTRQTATEYARLKHAVRTSGRTVPDNDIWIAAVALSNQMILLHRDRHFTFIPGISEQDWT